MSATTGCSDENSPWTLFATNNVFYDQFKDVRFADQRRHGRRLSLLSRARIWSSSAALVAARRASLAGRTTGGCRNRCSASSTASSFTQTQKFYGKLDYFPEWDQVGEYRMVADTGWEIVLVQPSNLSLKTLGHRPVRQHAERRRNRIW